MAGPLEGIQVLDLTRNVAGPYATKLMADYGADVLKVEPPDGDPSREAGPFPGDEPHPEKSSLFLHLNTNKRSITLDASTPDGQSLITRLAARSDVVLEDFSPGQAGEWGIGWDQLSADREDLVMASITPFGQNGPYRDYLGSEITLEAMGGPLLNTGHGEKQPLKLGGSTAHYHAGATAAFAIMTTRLRVEMGGEGDHIDLSVFECQAGFRDRRTIFVTGASYTGDARPRPIAGTRLGSGVRPCLDGYVNLLAGRRIDEFLALIEKPELKASLPDVPPNQMPADVVEMLETEYLMWLLPRTKTEIIARAQELRILSGAILTVEDLVTDEHYSGRGVWDEIEHPVAGTFTYPGRPMVMSASPRPNPEPAPLLGEHNEEVFVGELGIESAELERLRSQGVV